MDLRCPACEEALGLRLLPDHDSWAWCLRCDRPIDPSFLDRSDLPAPLLARLKKWDRWSSEITGIGIQGDYGSDLDDAAFVAEWKEVRRETLSILEELRRFIPAEADVVKEVFERMERWTDRAIADWRRWKLRLRLIQEYGALVGEQFAADRGKSIEKPKDLPQRCPRQLQDREERLAFQVGYELAALLHQPSTKPSSTRRLRDLEKQLGIS